MLLSPDPFPAWAIWKGSATPDYGCSRWVMASLAKRRRLGKGSALARLELSARLAGVCPALSASPIVSFPDPAFKLDKGLAHFARNLGLPDLAGKE